MGQGLSQMVWLNQPAAETRLSPGLFRCMNKEIIVFMKPISLLLTDEWTSAQNTESFSSIAEETQNHTHLYLNPDSTTTKGISLGK